MRGERYWQLSDIKDISMANPQAEIKNKRKHYRETVLKIINLLGDKDFEQIAEMAIASVKQTIIDVKASTEKLSAVLTDPVACAQIEEINRSFTAVVNQYEQADEELKEHLERIRMQQHEQGE